MNTPVLLKWVEQDIVGEKKEILERDEAVCRL